MSPLMIAYSKNADVEELLASDVPDDPVLDDFCLLVLDPVEVDHLNLKSNERHLFHPPDDDAARVGGTSWTSLRVNP